jgi:hypothetical protein
MGRFADLPVVIASGVGPSDVQMEDFDVDGNLDMVVAYFGRANAAGSFVPRDLIEVIYGSSSSPNLQITRADLPVDSGAHYLHVSDIDADGDLDLIVAASERDQVTIVSNDPGRLWSVASEVSVGARPVWAAASLLDADGYPDLVSTGLGGTYEISHYQRGSYALSIAANQQVTAVDFGLVPPAAIPPPQSTGSFLDSMDVSRNGAVELLDALLIINYLVLGDLSSASNYDVDGNGTFAALDALVVINHLLLQQNEPQSPPPVTFLRATKDTSSGSHFETRNDAGLIEQIFTQDAVVESLTS